MEQSDGEMEQSDGEMEQSDGGLPATINFRMQLNQSLLPLYVMFVKVEVAPLYRGLCPYSKEENNSHCLDVKCCIIQCMCATGIFVSQIHMGVIPSCQNAC